MEAFQPSNKDSRGRRKTSPHADEFYSRHIHSLKDPALEAEINRIAERLSGARSSQSTANELALKEKLYAKCMKFFFITGQNVSIDFEDASHYGSYTKIDDIFIEALKETIDHYDASEGNERSFTHMVRFYYDKRKIDAAYLAAEEDSAFGGSDTGALISLNDQVRRNDDGSTTLEDLVPSPDNDGDYGAPLDQTWVEIDEREIVGVADALEETALIEDFSTDDASGYAADRVDERILLRLLTIITGFLGKSGREANETRKLYTKMFFSETVTRTTKVRVEGELAPLQKLEKALFASIELPFQDSYTVLRCRTIKQLWKTEFIDGISEVGRPFNDIASKSDLAPGYSWTLPGKAYISYLNSIGRAASDALVSQQRARYDELLRALRS